MLNYVPIAKVATQLVAGFGVSKILSDIIKNNVTIGSPLQAVTVKVGGFVLGSILVEQSSNHIERVVNDMVEAWTASDEVNETEDKEEEMKEEEKKEEKKEPQKKA